MYLGRKIKSAEYNKYEQAVLKALPKDFKIPDPPLILFIDIGVSSTLADLDNTLKPFIDCLQLKYGFNDKHIYHIIANKMTVPKGDEFIEFNLEGKKE
jgi:Holliday junction resolvase RusA-like endonuclease